MEDKALELLNNLGKGNFQETLGLLFTSLDRENYFCTAQFTVTRELTQPMGILNGGATAGVMESIGSPLSTIFIDITKEYPLGISLNVNHIRSAKIGSELLVEAKIIHVGRKTHIVRIDIKTKEGKIISTGTLTNMIMPIVNL